MRPLDVLLTAALPTAVDPVPWARSQMAFTLAFHIVLVPLGVSCATVISAPSSRKMQGVDL